MLSRERFHQVQNRPLQLSHSLLRVPGVIDLFPFCLHVLHDQNLGYALALGMILITGVSNGAYIWLRGRAERWLR